MPLYSHFYKSENMKDKIYKAENYGIEILNYTINDVNLMKKRLNIGICGFYTDLDYKIYWIE